MPLPSDNQRYPAPHPLRATQAELMQHYAGVDPSVAMYPDTIPDTTGVNSSNNPRARFVNGNIVADLSSCIADLFMGEQINLRVDASSAVNGIVDEVTAEKSQTAMTGMMETNGAWSTIRTAAELAVVAGESYTRAIADPRYLGRSILEAIPATSVDPTFMYDRLISARIWKTLGTTTGGRVARWCEVRNNGDRSIENALFIGSANNIGIRVPLSEHPVTAGLPEYTVYPAGVNEMVWHLPAMLPSRHAPETSHGRSFFEGSETLINLHNGVYTFIARDVRTGGARIIVPHDALRRGMNGEAVWSNAQELFTSLHFDPQDAGQKIELLQGEIRAEDAVTIIKELTERIVSAAGLSPQTFGLGDFGTATSGTALRIRTAKTISTITGMRSLWARPIASMVFTLAALDRGVFGIDITPALPVPEFGPLVNNDPAAEAQTLLTQRQAGAVSVETAVRTLHPSWGDAEVADEVARLASENGLTV